MDSFLRGSVTSQEKDYKTGLISSFGDVLFILLTIEMTFTIARVPMNNSKSINTVSIIASYQNLYVHSTPASTPIMLTESVTDEYIEEQAVEKNIFLTPALITTSKFSDAW